MSDALSKFITGRMDSCGYTGANGFNVACAINQMFAPEIAVAQMGTQISGASQVSQSPTAANISYASIQELGGGGRSA